MNTSEPDINAKPLHETADKLQTSVPSLPSDSATPVSCDQLTALLSELKASQIELELQNEKLRQSEIELQLSKARYADLYNLAPIGYCTVNDQGLILESNVSASNVLGMTADAAKSMVFTQFITVADEHCFQSCRQRLLASGNPQSCELHLHPAKGSTIEVRLHICLTKGQNEEPLQLIAITDISQDKAADSAPHVKEEFNLSIFDSLSEHVAMLDKHGTIISVNEAWRQFSMANRISWVTADPVGVNYLELCHRNGQSSGCETSLQMYNAMQDVLEGRRAEYTFECSCRCNDQRHWFDVRVTPLHGSTSGLLVRHIDVTSWKLTKIALEESRRELVLVANQVPGRVARIDRNLRYVFANDYYEQFFGKPLSQVLGHRMPEVLGDELFQQVEANVSRVLAGEHVTFESEHQSSSGKTVHALTNYVPDRDSNERVIGFFVLAIDITETRMADKAKHAALDLLQKVTNRVPGAVYQFRLCADGKVTMPYCSDVLRQLIGIDTEILKDDATWFFTHAHPDEIDEFNASIQKSAVEMSEWSYEGRFEIDGVYRWLAGNSIPEPEPGGSIVWYGFITDVSKRRANDAAKESLESQLRESQKMEAIGTLASGIAHDFNNALATILGNLELIREHFFEHQEARQHINEIHRAGVRGRNLVQQILSYCRQQPTELQKISLSLVVQDTATLLRSTVPVRFSLHVHCENDHALILADATQIEQVIINLVNNAVQAFGSHSGTIIIRIDAIDSDDPQLKNVTEFKFEQSEPSRRLIRLSVSDDGPGIPASNLNRIFEPFFTTRPPGEGTGLGLSVVHGIVNSHGGAISVDSDPNSETVFRIYFPAIADAAEEPKGETRQPAVLQPASAGPISREGRQIVLIDDDTAVLRVLTLLLERDGYTVAAFTDPVTALDMIRRNPSRFHLLITDSNMPLMQGVDVAVAARAICPNLPIAVASGFIDDDLRIDAANAGVTELISKPFSLAELSAKLTRIFA